MHNYLKSLGFLVFYQLFFGCGVRESSSEIPVQKTMHEKQTVDDYKQLLQVGIAEQSAWSAHWAKNHTNVNENYFEWILTDSIVPMEMPESNPIKIGDPLFSYQFPHPEGRGTIDIYSYKIEAQNNLEKPFLNPDSEVVWYREDGMKERLLFMGPSGMFEEGLWLSPSEFLVLGYFQEEEGYLPMAWLIDVEKHLFSQFRLGTPSADYIPDSYLSEKLKLGRLH